MPPTPLPPPAAPPETEFVLLIADISGYTRFMLSSHTARVHAHGIVADLIAAVIAEARIPIEVNKLEGDAIFMVAGRPAAGWGECGREIGARLPAFVAAFDRRLTELATSNVCDCVACEQMVKLRLKVIGHVGTAARTHVAGFDELSGVDVIVLHRLLKNTVPSSEYILLTEPAHALLQPDGEFCPHVERYDDVGKVRLRLRLLDPRVPAAAPRRFSLRDMWRKLGYDIRYLLARQRHPAA
jgi:hypothetical protein